MVKQENFNNFTMIAIMSHVKMAHPNRCCGIILSDDSYIPLKNKSQHPTVRCKIDYNTIDKYAESGQLKGIAFSQTGDVKPTSEEMEVQIKYNANMCYVAYDGKRITEYYCFGDSLPVAPYEGRAYVNGYFDCFGLLRDYYRKELNIQLKNLPRNPYKKEQDSFGYFTTEHFQDVGFGEINNKDIEIGDVVVYQINNIPCHLGIYCDHGYILFHDMGRKSRIISIEVIPFQHFMTLRHKDKV